MKMARILVDLGMNQLFLFATVLLPPCLVAAPVYIGTSSTRGIYVADFDSTTGKLTKPTLAADYPNPGFIIIHPTRPLLYAVGKAKTSFADGSSALAAFAISSDHSLKFLSEISTGGKGACHLAIDPSARTIAIANYGDGHISTVRLDENGIPEAMVSLIANTGSGPNVNRQQGPHAHGVYFDQTGQHLFVPDLGLDRIFVYPFDAKTSKLGAPLLPLVTAPGAGPRHMAFSPDDRFNYVINELNNTVTVTDYLAKSAEFKVIGVEATLPKDFLKSNTAAEIEVHSNGKFLYASNRGKNCITVYQRNEKTGALMALQHAAVGGKSPRHFKIDPSGKWLICANQDSDDLSVLALDPETGLLGAPEITVSAPSPTCVLFVR